MAKNIPENIDAATYMGHWPFHRIPDSQPQKIIDSLIESNTALALVTPLNSVFYKDPHDGLEEMMEMLQGLSHVERLRYVPVVNPSLPYWKRDYANYLSMKNVAGLRLFPGYHGYQIRDDCCVELVLTAAKDNVPIFINIRLQDSRIRHIIDVGVDVELTDIENLASSIPQAKICLSRISTAEILSLSENSQIERNLYFDTATVIADSFYENISDGGLIDRLLYASARPIQHHLCSIEPIIRGGISDFCRQKIMKKNAEDFIGGRL